MLPFVHGGNFKRPQMHVPGLLELAQDRHKSEDTTLVETVCGNLCYLESVSKGLGPVEFRRRWRKALWYAALPSSF